MIIIETEDTTIATKDEPKTKIGYKIYDDRSKCNIFGTVNCHFKTQKTARKAIKTYLNTFLGHKTPYRFLLTNYQGELIKTFTNIE